MKKCILFLCFSFWAFFAFGQTINGVDDVREGYMRIIVTEVWNAPKTKPKIEFEFAENSGVPKKPITEIRDADDKLMVFNTGIDALNFFIEEFVFTLEDTYAISIGNTIIHYYIMKI
jgi:hypothetical protein